MKRRAGKAIKRLCKATEFVIADRNMNDIRILSALVCLLSAACPAPAPGPASTDTVDDGDAAVTSDLPRQPDVPTSPDVTPDQTAPPCTVRAAVPPTTDFFVDISAESGIRSGNYDPNPVIPVPINDHSRLAFADLNGDGFDDIVAHSLYPNAQSGVPFSHVVLLNNGTGDGTFSDHSAASGLADLQAAFFVFGDVDNDGDQDCFAGLDVQLPGQRHQVLLNDGSGVFTVVAGSGPDSESATVAGNAVFADFNGDANLDLFIGNGHTSFGAPDVYYEGNGDGTFAPASAKFPGMPMQPTNGTVACDYDNDNDLDIFVSVYGVSLEKGANALWENDGTGVFSNVAVARGFASLPGGNYFLGHAETSEPGATPGTYVGSNGFGLDCKDITNDGLLDVFVTSISHPVEGDYNRKWSDPTQLLVNTGAAGGFAFQNEFLQRALPFNEGDVDGAAVDFDNDGRLDLSVSRDKKYEKNYTDVAQKAWFGLMPQEPDGTYASLGPVSGLNETEAAVAASLLECTDTAQCPSGEECISTRCRTPCSSDAECLGPQELCHTNGFCKLLLTMKNAQNHAWADVDGDGDQDLLVGGRDTGGGRPNFLFRNDIGQDNRWLSIRVEGDGVNVNRDGIGARVSLVFGDRTLLREVRSSRGMHSSADSRALHFGLGDLPCDYTIEVRWPDGETATFAPGALPEETHLRLVYPDQLAP